MRRRSRGRRPTNENGVAKTKHEFNNFGNYRFTVKVKVDGEVVDTDRSHVRGLGPRERRVRPALGVGEA